MKVHHISAATLCPISARLVNGEGGLFSPGRLVCHCLLVESRDGLVLVDTGIGRDDMRDIRKRMGFWFEKVVRPRADVELTAFGQIEQLGFDPRDVRHVVPTHLDLDHAGGLPDFPGAQVHVFRPEHDAAMKRRTRKERERYKPWHWSHGPAWDVREVDGETWFGFEKVSAIDRSEEVLIVPLVGHTRGHVGVAVRSDRGWILHAGDAYFFHGEMAPTPRCPPGLALFQRMVVTNNRDRLHNQARLRELVQTHGDEVSVHCAHCPVELERLAAEARS
jgi:glyoxylase-like metal-dependent hydrolase (beta-lactamase superfamily II)